jgi:hypothetical protein
VSIPGSSPRAYVDRPVGDVVAATRAARAAALAWELDPEPQLLRVGMNAIFRCTDRVLRVSMPSVPARASIELSEFLRSEGIAVPVAARPSAVVDGHLQVTCWEWIEPSGHPVDWAAVGAMVRKLHGVDPVRLPPGVPLPAPTVFPWWNLDELLARTAPVLDAEARRGIERTMERHRGWREFSGSVVCHGDVHPGNVIMAAEGPVLLDWDLLCWAPPGWDHAPLMTWATRWGGPGGEYEAFARGYGASLTDHPHAVALAELRLVAATLMRLVAGMADPAAMPEAQLRLRYWRGDPGSPHWTAQ